MTPHLGSRHLLPDVGLEVQGPHVSVMVELVQCGVLSSKYIHFVLMMGDMLGDEKKTEKI